MFSNIIVTFVAIYPKQLFVVRCPTFLFSKLVRRLVEPSGYIDCEKCLALKEIFDRLALNVDVDVETDAGRIRRLAARSTKSPSYSPLIFQPNPS